MQVDHNVHIYLFHLKWNVRWFSITDVIIHIKAVMEWLHSCATILKQQILFCRCFMAIFGRTSSFYCTGNLSPTFGYFRANSSICWRIIGALWLDSHVIYKLFMLLIFWWRVYFCHPVTKWELFRVWMYKFVSLTMWLYNICISLIILLDSQLFYFIYLLGVEVEGSMGGQVRNSACPFSSHYICLTVHLNFSQSSSIITQWQCLSLGLDVDWKSTLYCRALSFYTSMWLDHANEW